MKHGKKYNAAYKQVDRTKEYGLVEAIEFLKSITWNGNVRELENLIERASILIKSQEIKSFLH